MVFSGLFVIGYGDVGPGTIVGSAVFNMLVALGLVGLFAGQVVLTPIVYFIGLKFQNFF